NHEGIAETSRALRDFGARRSDFDRHAGAAGFLLPDYDELGFNYRMTDIQAAIGLVQLGRSDGLLERRRELARRYDELLSDVKWLRTPRTPPDHVHGYQSYVCLFAPEPADLRNLAALNASRNALMAALESEGIATRQGTHAAAIAGYYR